MYSMIPVPNIKWEDDTLKYTMMFFPAVGVAIGAALWLWAFVCGTLGISETLFAAVNTAVPIVITGAIHLDGLIDTGDAIFSRQSRERKLEILKDSHVGAFGVISVILYVLIYFGVSAEFYCDTKFLFIYGLGFIISRCLSSVAVMNFKKAKDTGLVNIFSDGAQKKAVTAVNIITAVFCAALMIYINIYAGLAAIIAGLLWYIIWRAMCKKIFGGITGDLCGMFVCIFEVVILIAVTIGTNIF